MSIDLFGPKPRRKARVLMHVIDAGMIDGNPIGAPKYDRAQYVWCRMQCARCKRVEEFHSLMLSEAKRGRACEVCNGTVPD